MKKSSYLVMTLVVFCFLAFNIQAQYGTKSTTELGGTISYSSTTAVTNGTKASESTSLFNIMPFISYFISDGLSIGLSPGVNIVKLAGTKESVTNLMLFAVPGYTFGTKGNVYPFLEGWVGYSTISTKTDPISGTGEIDLSGLSFGGRGGIKVLVGKSGLFNASVSYMMYNLSPKNADKRSGYNNLAFTFGFSVFISK